MSASFRASKAYVNVVYIACMYDCVSEALTAKLSSLILLTGNLELSPAYRAAKKSPVASRIRAAGILVIIIMG